MQVLSPWMKTIAASRFVGFRCIVDGSQKVFVRRLKVFCFFLAFVVLHLYKHFVFYASLGVSRFFPFS